MVVLSSFICSKAGNVVLSRQFVEMPKTRIEHLISSFPKLLSSKEQQHTFIETDLVRFIYQPIDKLYLVLITNKASNIVQDIETLNLFSRVLGEYLVKSTDVREIALKKFELILVFDEIISLGYRENVNLGQIKTINTMESNDERLAAELQKQKEREAKEESKRRAQMMDLKRLDRSSSGLDASARFRTEQTTTLKRPEPDYKSYQQPQFQPQQPQMPMGKGMKLAKMGQSLVETIKAEEGVTNMVYTPPVPVVSPTQQQQKPKQTSAVAPTTTTPSINMSQQGINLSIEEKVTINCDRDGGFQGMEINGTMTLCLNDPSEDRLLLFLHYPPEVNGKTHPNVDKTEFSKSSRIQLRDPTKSFPNNQSLSLLKYKVNTQDESKVPVTITCWPADSGDKIDLTIEYEWKSPPLRNLIVRIPINK